MNSILFSENLKKIIAQRNLKLKMLSKKTGIPESTLSEWTNGRSPKLSPALLNLCAFLDISLEELIGQKSRQTFSEAEARFRVMIEGSEYWLILQKIKK